MLIASILGTNSKYSYLLFLLFHLLQPSVNLYCRNEPHQRINSTFSIFSNSTRLFSTRPVSHHHTKKTSFSIRTNQLKRFQRHRLFIPKCEAPDHYSKAWLDCNKHRLLLTVHFLSSCGCGTAN